VADFYSTFAGNSQYRTHCRVTAGAQSAAGNSTAVTALLEGQKLSGGGYWTSASGNTASVSGDVAFSANGWAPYDFRNYSTKTFGSDTDSVVHGADGTKTAAGSYAANDSAGGNFGAASGSWALGLTPIPRAAVQRYEGSFESANVERWDGSAWVLQTLERWDGSAWVRQN
jgi:hypothetical protein